MIKQANESACVLCDLESDCLGEKEYMRKRAMDTEYQSKKKSE